MPAAATQKVRFGPFELDRQTAELSKFGVKVKLQGQPIAVLCLLLNRSGELVSRQELRQHLWPEDTFVDFEHSLNTDIKKLRQALGDEARRAPLHRDAAAKGIPVHCARRKGRECQFPSCRGGNQSAAIPANNP